MKAKCIWCGCKIAHGKLYCYWCARRKREVWLPATFWHDHADRELPAGELIREAGRRVLVEVTPEELAEIRSDAAYYSDKSGGPDWAEGGPIRRSAAATVRAIDRLSMRISHQSSSSIDPARGG